MLCLENYQWELHHIKICVSDVNMKIWQKEIPSTLYKKIFYDQLKCLHCYAVKTPCFLVKAHTVWNIY